MFFYTKVVGVTFEGRQAIISRLNRMGLLESGEQLILQREPTNPYDQYAVAVLASNGDKIGYLSKDCAKQISQNMSLGARYSAYVSDVTGGDAGSMYGVNIQIVY